MSRETVSVVVMTFNEAATLETVVDGLATTLEAAETPYEIVVLDDGSDDATPDVAERLAKANPRVRVHRHSSNLGLGGVYKSGFELARGDLLTFFPADGQFPPENLDRLLAHSGSADLVLGYLKGTDSWVGSALARVERLLYRWAFGPLPRFQGIFLVRLRRLRELRLISEGRGWAIVMEMIVRAQRANWRVSSVLTELRPREAGRSKARNLRAVLANLSQLARLRSAL